MGSLRLLPALFSLGTLGWAAETHFGKPFTLKTPVGVSDLMSRPADHVGKTVQVTGKVTETCERMGCWMNLTDPASGKRIRIKVVDGDIVFPKTAVGKMAIAEGKMSKLELTREQAVAAARHEAEEQGRAFDQATVKSGMLVYQIQGSGASILD